MLIEDAGELRHRCAGQRRGFCEVLPIEQITPEHWRRTVDVNLTCACADVANYTFRENGRRRGKHFSMAYRPSLGFATAGGGEDRAEHVHAMHRTRG
ncbi:MAG: hypothetical protein R3C45_13060 [Phycisphaerales bacterium]